jgi:hypothetical protein
MKPQPAHSHRPKKKTSWFPSFLTLTFGTSADEILPDRYRYRYRYLADSRSRFLNRFQVENLQVENLIGLTMISASWDFDWIDYNKCKLRTCQVRDFEIGLRTFFNAAKNLNVRELLLHRLPRHFWSSDVDLLHRLKSNQKNNQK